MSAKILIRRGAAANLPTEADLGELLATTDTHKLYLGQGTGNALVEMGGGSGVSGDVYTKYQILDDTNGNAAVSGCYCIATGQIYGNKSGTDGSYKTLNIRIGAGIKVRMISAYFTGTEIGATSKYGIVLFDATGSWTGMPNNGTSPTYPEFISPQIQVFNGSATMKDALPSVVPRFTTNGTTLNLLAIGAAHTTASNAMMMNILF